jgi:hypothetical protein
MVIRAGDGAGIVIGVGMVMAMEEDIHIMDTIGKHRTSQIETEFD